MGVSASIIPGRPDKHAESFYRVNSIAEIPGREPVRTEQLVAVSAVEPPVIAQVPALVFFLVIVALGLGAGRLSKTLVIR